MRVLVSYRGSPNIRGFETGHLISEAFRELGHEVFEYGNIYESNDLIGPGFRELYGHYKFQPDLWLAMETNDAENSIIQPKYLNPKKIAYWCFDISMYPEHCKQYAESIDAAHVFCANPNYLRLFKAASFLPYAAAPQFIRPLNFAKQYDVGLVGSDRPERQALIADLRAANINAHLITGVFREAYIDALASCKIVINDIAGGGKGLMSMRGLEAPAAGSLTIFEDAEALGDLFIPGIDCLTYQDSKDLIAKCDSLLRDQQYLDQVRAAGQKRVLENHMYVHRAQEILDVIGY